MRTKNHIRIICLLIILLVKTNVYSQLNSNSQFYFSKLGLKDGLSQISVMSIFQDSKGYMWFGTRDGLNCYDGNTFTVFSHDNSNKNSLSDNQITCIKEDNMQHLWIGSINGLNKMDLKNEKIKTYNIKSSNNYISSLLIDKDKRLLIGTQKGLYEYIPKTDNFIQINWTGTSEVFWVNALYQLSTGQILIGTSSKGLYVCDNKFKLLSHFNTSSPHPLTGNDIKSIYEDSQHQVWIGDESNGINKLNINTGEVFQYTTLNSGLSSNKIRCFIEKDNKLIIGTFNGLNVMDLSTYTIENMTNNYGQSNGLLSHPSIYSSYVDRVGTLWIGTYSGGVNYHNVFNNRFRFYDPESKSNVLFGIYGSMAYQYPNTLWISTEGGGLLNYNTEKHIFKNYLIDASPKWDHSLNIVKSLLIEGNTIWCGTVNGKVYKFNTETKKINFGYQLKKNGSIAKIYRDNSENLWMTNSSENTGLYRLTKELVLQNSFEISNNKRIRFPNVRCFLELHKNVFLIGMRNEGLALYNADKKTIERYNRAQKGNHQLLNNYITSILRTTNNEIWIATHGGGFFLFNEDRGVIKRITKKQGLINNNVCAILESKDKSLWLSTGNGLSQFNPLSGKIRNFEQTNGINVREFSPNGGIVLPSGEMFFSGSNGIVSFNPLQLKDNPYLPPIVIRSLSINNKVIEPNDSTHILTSTIENTEKIVLKYDQNNININYAALNFIFPEQNQYAYKLVGHEDKWNYVGNRKTAYYTSLSPGTYTFKVIASNNDQKWNNAGKSFEIVVLAPIWATWYAYLIYFLLFVIIAGTLLYYATREKQLKENLRIKQFEQQKLEEFHQAKVRLFTNFSHDIRTPLTLIITPLEDILRRVDINTSVKNTIQLIYNNSQRLLLLVNQLMDLRKNQTGNMQLNVTEQNLTSFIEEIYFVFKPIAESKNIQFEFTHIEEKSESWFDKNLFEKVMFNVLSNAFKFTKEGGAIKINIKAIASSELKTISTSGIEEIRHSAQYVCLSISDTGKGISADEIEHIFTPFYQVHNETENIIGTGIGLSLALSIVRLHHGVMWVESNISKGSVFNMAIPTNKEDYELSEISEASSEEIVEQLKTDNLESHKIALDISNDKPTVLLVEDNQEVRKYFKEQLKSYFKIIESDNGVDGFEKALKHFPDIVVTDIMMPKVDGLQLCALIKNDLNTGHIPVILLTAKSMVMHVKEGFEYGADDYLIKPFNMEVLVIRIRNLIASRKKLKELYAKPQNANSFLLENASADDRFTQKFFKIIEDNISNSEMDIELICSEMGLSRANMYRKLKGITELTPIELIRNKRLEIAAQMLINSEMNISEVSTETGFNSQAYFTNSFKKVYGISPTEFIQIKRGEIID